MTTKKQIIPSNNDYTIAWSFNPGATKQQSRFYSNSLLFICFLANRIYHNIYCRPYVIRLFRHYRIGGGDIKDTRRSFKFITEKPSVFYHTRAWYHVLILTFLFSVCAKPIFASGNERFLPKMKTDNFGAQPLRAPMSAWKKCAYRRWRQRNRYFIENSMLRECDIAYHYYTNVYRYRHRNHLLNAAIHWAVSLDYCSAANLRWKLKITHSSAINLYNYMLDEGILYKSDPLDQSARPVKRTHHEMAVFIKTKHLHYE